MKRVTDLDIAIMTRIAGGFTRFYEIWPGLATGRQVDRRLQALRKSGMIACRGQSWHLTGSLRAPSSSSND